MNAAAQLAAPARRSVRTAASATNAKSEPKAPEHTHSELKAALARVAALIKRAAGVEENRPWSGDSDRILWSAAFEAETRGAMTNTPEAGRKFGFDVAALIKAARLVPGDVESPERTKYLEQAARELCWIIDSESPYLELIDPKASRASSPSSPCKRADTTESTTAIAADHIDFLSTTLGRAHAILTMLVDLFGGATSITTPALSTGINGTLDFLVETLAGADEVAQQIPRGARPQSLSSHVHQARSLAELLGDMLNADDFDWCYSSGVYSNYFDAIGHAVRCAIEAMEVKSHG